MSVPRLVEDVGMGMAHALFAHLEQSLGFGVKESSEFWVDLQQCVGAQSQGDHVWAPYGRSSTRRP